MESSYPIPVVGLTGGIASGKTTVAGFLRDSGAFVVDADRLAHEALDPGGRAHEAVVERFGPGIVDPAGRISRAALAGIVFTDETARADLNALVHPAVRAESGARVAVAAQDGASLAILDAALLVETGYYRELDGLIVVRCSVETQLRRLERRDGLTEAEARARIDAQWPSERKVAVADWVIDTEGTLSATRERVRQVYGEILSRGTRPAGDV